jgi:GAF domain-containing protein
MLAVAATLAAASAGVELPPWVVCSACLADPLDADLRLAPTGEISRKVRLCLGREPAFDIRYLINCIYQHDRSPGMFGPLDRRTRSGEVRLLLTSTHVHGWSESERRALGARPLPLADANLSPGNLPQLKNQIEELGRGGLLLVQVPTVWHALRWLGIPTASATSRERTSRERERPDGANLGECYAFFVPAEPCGSDPKAEQDYRDRRARDAEAELARLLEHSPSIPDKLTSILRSACAWLGCVEGNIRRVTPDGEWLDHAASHGPPQMEHLPFWVPASKGINGRAFHTKEMQIACTQQQVQEHSDWSRPGGTGRQLEDLYPPEACQRYRQLLSTIRSCVVIPLLHGGEAIGVLCLHRHVEGDFDEEALHIVEAIARKASDLLAYLVQHDRLTQQRLVPGVIREVNALLRQLDRRPLGEAIHALGNSLARLARQLAGGYRACVRLLDHAGESLAVIGLDGDPGAWPPEFASLTFPRKSKGDRPHAAYVRALEDNESYVIDDTLRKDVSYEEVKPPAAAHMAIVLRHGSQAIGVLSIDFDQKQRTRCHAETRRDLEDLASIHAAHIHSFHREQLYGQLSPPRGALENGELFHEGLRRWLRDVGRALGVTRGSLYIRDPETGHYRRDVFLEEPENNADALDYAPHEGRTGWVAAEKRPLLIADCADLREVVKIKPRLQPARCPDCYEAETEKLSYLGVPVLVGTDALAVLRFILVTPRQSDGEMAAGKTSFTMLDLQLAQAAAAQLSPWLHRRQEERQAAAVQELTRTLLQAASRHEIGACACEAIARGIGSCSVVVRAVEGFDRGGGQPVEVLDRIFVSEGARELWPEVRQRGEGISGWVWQNQKPYVCQDTQTEPLLQMDRARNNEEAWRQNASSVVLPLFAGAEFLGTLGVHRLLRGNILGGDVDFIKRVAELTGQALHDLGNTETRRIQEAILWALLDYYQEKTNPQGDREPEDQLLYNLAGALRNGLSLAPEGALAWIWRYNDQTNKYEGLPSGDRLDLEVVHKALGGAHAVVVSAPEEDQRLDLLVRALPVPQQRLAHGCQRAALLLARSERYRLLPLPPTLFLLVLRPPHRMSSARIHEMLRLLNITLGRPAGAGLPLN